MQPALHDVPHPSLGDTDALRAVLLSSTYLALVGLLGLVGISTITRHTANAIGTLVGFLYTAALLAVGGGLLVRRDV